MLPLIARDLIRVLVIGMLGVLFVSKHSVDAFFQAAPPPVSDALHHLRTAWVLLGTLEVKDEAKGEYVWAESGPPGYSLVASGQSGDMKRLLPQRGDLIRFHYPKPLVILRYASEKESQALLSPAKAEQLSQSDYTPYELSPDAVVKIAEVAMKSFGDLRVFWVRVERFEVKSPSRN